MIPTAPISQPTADTLHLMAGDPRKEAEYREFIAACWASAQENGGLVRTNDVRARLSNEHGLTIYPRQFSAYFCRATTKTGPLQKTGEWEICVDPLHKNSGRPQPVRRWIAAPLEAAS